MRLGAMPTDEAMAAVRDFPAFAFEARVLRPLMWFGLLEQHSPGHSRPLRGERPLYRKAPLFDRFLTFDVALEGGDQSRH